MKKLLTIVGTVALTIALIFLMVPKTEAEATEADFQMDGTTLMNYTGTASNVSIPSTVEIIGRSAFENNNVVKKVTIPDSVKTIEEYAFWGCNKLESVSLGKGLYEVGDFAFAACENLKEVSLSDSIRNIGIMAFADCKSLTDIYIPDTVTSIHSTAFDGVYHLNIRAEQYSYPYNYAIARGEAIANVPEYLKATPTPEPTAVPEPTPVPTPTPIRTPTPEPGVLIGSTSIVGNSALVMIDNEEMDTAQGYEDYWNVMQDGTLQGSTMGGALQGSSQPAKTKLADWTYYGDSTLKNMELGENVISIGSFAFSRSSLQTITLPEGVESIEYAAFYYCEDLKEIQIPDSVTYIGEKAFAGTPWLESFYDGSMKLEQNSDFLIVGDGVLLAYRGTLEKNEAEKIIPAEVKYVATDAFR